MPFTRPTLPELIDTGAAEFETRLPGVLARARRSIIGVLNRVVAGGLASLYGYWEWLDRQKWPDLAEGQYLQAHGDRWGVARLGATFATGTARFTGTDGATIAASSELQRADGARFVTTAAGTIAGGVALVPVAASVAGAAGNTAAAAALTLTTPISGVASAATLASAASNGTEADTDEEFRARILLRIRSVPQGGSLPDYVRWINDVPGVTRCWVAPAEQGLGSVVVRFVRDGDADMIPDAAEVAAVQAALNLVRPVTADVRVVAPLVQLLNLSIKITPDTAAVRAAVEAELLDLLRRDDVGQLGANRPGGTILLSQLREAVSIATGEGDNAIVSPTANVVLPAGTLAKLGAITWVAN